MHGWMGGWLDTSIAFLVLQKTASVKFYSSILAMKVMESVKEEMLMKYLDIRERK
jgi:hypothetical protein